MVDAGSRDRGFVPRFDANVEDAAARKRARREVASGVEPSRLLPAGEGRRLSEAERRALQERRRARTPAPPPPPTPLRVPPSRPVPRMPRAQPERSAPASRGMVVLGALLIAGLAVVAFAGGRLFGSGGDGPPPDRQFAGVIPTGIPDLGTPAVAPGVGAPVAGTPAPAGASTGRAPVVCLDPGHGGPDRGFQRTANELAPAMEEAVVVLLHAWDLEARLELHGYDVAMTRRTDIAVNADDRDVNGDGKTARDDSPGTASHRNLDELQARINVCNEARADLLVSMHANGFPNPDVRGYETWYTREREFGDRNQDFALMAYRHLKEQLAEIGYVLPEQLERGANPDSTLERDSPHAQYKHLVVLGPPDPGKIVASEMPGAIVETLFVSNDGDAAVLASPAGREAIVSAYELAILEYFEEYPPAPR